jgi:enoyl-CoA hydratase/carnithine racemase
MKNKEILMSDTSALIKRVSEEEGIAWLTLNRPERKNALSKALMAEIIDCLKELR